MNADAQTPSPVARLIEALRQELHEYGEMLARLEQQQEHVMVRAADEVLHSVVAINEQAARIQEARRQREQCQRELAAVVGADVRRLISVSEAAPQGEASSLLTSAPTSLQAGPQLPDFAALVPLLPEVYRAAVSELVRENNDLLVRVQQRARQNHLLLSRSLELMQRFVHSLAPTAPPTTYTGQGIMQANPTPSLPIYEAVG